MSETKRLYKVIFFNQGQIYEVYSRQVSQGGLHGFVEVEELVFGERSQVVVDPGEDRLKQEFAGVRRFYVPMHAVVRIDEVEREGVSRIAPAGDEGGGGKIAPFPLGFYRPGEPGDKS